MAALYVHETPAYAKVNLLHLDVRDLDKMLTADDKNCLAITPTVFLEGKYQTDGLSCVKDLQFFFFFFHSWHLIFCVYFVVMSSHLVLSDLIFYLFKIPLL